MIIPEIKRVRTFEAMKGKRIAEIQERGFCLRLVFSDGTFADLDTDTNTTAKIVLDKGRPSRTRPFH